MIVRDLLMSVGIQMDKSGVKEADSAINGLVEAAKDLGVAFGFQQIFAGMKGMVNAASEVNEAMNVINQSFGEGTDEVIAWAKESGEAMGRSEYQMRQMAANFGAILSPMLGPNMAANFSKTLSDLSVDLGSFFNMADEEAQQRLLSGLMGETEAVRRLGVNLSDASLNAFAMSEGLGKTTQQMSEQEKVMLRYRKILADTKNAQGDAERTGDGYANQVKRLEGDLNKLSVTIGGRLIESFNKLVGGGIKVTDFFSTIVKDSHMLDIAIYGLGTAFVVFAGKVLLANLPLVTFAAFLVGMVAMIDQVWKAYDGDTSVISEFWKSVIGEEKWDRVKQTWKESMEALGNLVYEWMDDQGGAWDRYFEKIYGKGGKDFKEAFGLDSDTAKAVGEFWEAVKNHTGAPDLDQMDTPLDLGDMFAPMPETRMRSPGDMFTTPPVPGMRGRHGAGTSINVRGGDITITNQGNVPPATVREAGQTAGGLQQKQNRDLANSAAQMATGQRKK